MFRYLNIVIVFLTVAYGLTGCGGAPPPPPPLPPASPECAEFQAKAAQVWDEEDRNDAWSSFNDIDLAYAPTAADYYVSVMDNTVRDWTLKTQTLCEEQSADKGTDSSEKMAVLLLCV